MLEREYEYLESIRSSLIEKYKGRYVLIVGEELVSNFANQAEAYSYAIKNYKPGQFLIEKITDATSGAVHRFTSLVYV